MQLLGRTGSPRVGLGGRPARLLLLAPGPRRSPPGQLTHCCHWEPVTSDSWASWRHGAWPAALASCACSSSCSACCWLACRGPSPQLPHACEHAGPVAALGGAAALPPCKAWLTTLPSSCHCCRPADEEQQPAAMTQAGATAHERECAQLRWPSPTLQGGPASQVAVPLCHAPAVLAHKRSVLQAKAKPPPPPPKAK